MLQGCLPPIVVMIRLADRLAAYFTLALVGKFCTQMIHVRHTMLSVKISMLLPNQMQG